MPESIEQEIFEDFLAELEKDSSVSSDLVVRLRRLGVKGITKGALSTAISGAGNIADQD